jgi:hypothetical protein
MNVSRPGEWTVLIYTSASRDLEPAVSDSLQEISDAFQASAFDTPVVAQFGRDNQAERLELCRSGAPSVVQKLADVDMTAPANLQDFLRWGMQRYPARHYAVVLGGHGAGFAGAVTDADRRKMMRLPDIQATLGELPQPPELVIFNTCLMAQAEVAAELSSVTPHLVAAQGKLHGLGLPLGAWLQRLDTTSGGAAAAAELVDAAAEVPQRAPMVSALDLQRWPDMQASLDGLAAEILNNLPAAPMLRGHITQQPSPWPQAGERPLSDMLDLRRLCTAWKDDVRLPAPLRAAAEQVLQRLEVAVQNTSQPEWGGLSALLPAAGLQSLGTLPGELYNSLDWAQQTRWDEALRALKPT